MKVQGSSYAQLQHQLVEMAKGAGEPLRQEVKSIIEQDSQDNKTKSDLRQQLIDLSRDLNKEMQRINTDINFRYNDDIHGLIVSVREGGSGKVLREIPSEEAIELMKKMRDVIGNIFDKKA